VKFDADFYLDDRLSGKTLSRALEFIHREYVEDNMPLLGPQAVRAATDFRRVIGTALDELSDDQVFAIIRFAVFQRRNYLKVVELSQRRTLQWGWTDHVGGEAGNLGWCRFAKDKYIEIQPASIAVATFVNLSLAEQRSILKSAEARLADPSFIPAIEKSMQWPDVIPGHLHFEGLGVPPFHRECTCLVFAAVPGASDHAGPAHEVERLRRLPKQTMFKITVKRE
jgi:hypothetical protein